MFANKGLLTGIARSASEQQYTLLGVEMGMRQVCSGLKGQNAQER